MKLMLNAGFVLALNAFLAYEIYAQYKCLSANQFCLSILGEMIGIVHSVIGFQAVGEILAAIITVVLINLVLCFIFSKSADFVLRKTHGA